MGQLVERADMYQDLRWWLDRNLGPGWATIPLSDDTVAHLADHLVAERGWRR